MKKILLILAIFFAQISATHAITYGGSSSASFPNVFATGGSPQVFLPFFNVALNEIPYAFNPAVGGDSTVTSLTIGYGLFFQSGWNTESGSLSVSTINCGATHCPASPTSNVGLDFRIYPTSTGSVIYVDFHDRNPTDTITDSRYLAFLPSAFMSPTGLGDFIIYFMPKFTAKDCFIGVCGTFLDSIDTWIYTNSDNNVEHTLIDFTETAYGAPINAGSIMFGVDPTGSIMGYGGVGANIRPVFFFPVAGYVDYSQIFTFLTNTGGTNLSYYLPNWLGASGSVEGGAGTGTGGTGTGSTPFDSTGWYADCGSFLTDFTCYISSTFNNTIGALFPTITFDGEFKTCDFALSSASGSYLQKFANVIAVINPIPPDDGQPICMFFSGTGTMAYQRIIPEENWFEHYVPGALPQVEGIDITPLGQSILDLVVIFSITVLIFHKKGHD